MKQVVLLFLIGLVFVAFGISEIDDHSISIEGPPPQDGLPELLHGSPDHPASARLEILPSPNSPRRLIYKFHLPSGSYDRLRWIGHGVPLPPELTICDYAGHEVATFAPPEEMRQGGMASPRTTWIIQPTGLFPLVKWLLANVWFWALAVLLFFSFRDRLAMVVQRLVTWPESRLPWATINRRTLLLTVIALAAVWLCLIVPGAIRFDVGDDPAMELLASGQVTGHPSEYLIFINVLIGLFLKGLYLTVPAVPWYPLLFLSSVLFCLVGITALLLQEELSDRFGWVCLFGFVFGVYFTTHLQFTSAAFLLGMFGILIFTQGTSRGSLAWAVLLVMLGSLIRFESLILLLITTTGAAWLLSRRPIRDKVIFFALILLLGWGGKAFDRAYYDRTAGWPVYRQYLFLLGDLHMTPKINYGEQNRPVYAQVGWSGNDFTMFSGDWLYEDAAAFSADKLTYLDKHLVSNRTASDVLLTLLVAIALAPAPTLLFFTLLFHKLQRRNLSLPMLAAIVGPMLLIVLDLALTARLPARVFAPPIYGASLFLLLATREEGETGRSLKSTFALPLVFITLTVLSLSSLGINAAQNDRAAKRIIAALNQLAPYSGQTFVSSINAVLLERLDPMTALSETRNVNLVHLMWSGGSPSFASQLQRSGSASLFQSIASDPRFWLIVPTSQQNRADDFSLYMKEHYHQDVKMVPVVLADGMTAVFSDFTVLKAVPAGSGVTR